MHNMVRSAVESASGAYSDVLQRFLRYGIV